MAFLEEHLNPVSRRQADRSDPLTVRCTGPECRGQSPIRLSKSLSSVAAPKATGYANLGRNRHGAPNRQ